MNQLRIGTVTCFDEPECSKAQALKVLEEASEVYNAYQLYKTTIELREDDKAKPDYIDELNGCAEMFRGRLLEECADVIQAVSNLVFALGKETPYLEASPDNIYSFSGCMETCKFKNAARGRITLEEE